MIRYAIRFRNNPKDITSVFEAENDRHAQDIGVAIVRLLKHATDDPAWNWEMWNDETMKKVVEF